MNIRLPLCPFCNLSRSVQARPVKRDAPLEPGVTQCLLTDEFIPEGQEPFHCDHFIERCEATTPSRDWSYIEGWNNFCPRADGRFEG